MAEIIANTNRIPMWVVWSSQNLGWCGAGDITVTYTPNWSDQTQHQAGSYVVDSWFTGATITAQVTISEVNEEAILAVVFPAGEEQNDTTDDRFAMTKIADMTTESSYAGVLRASTLAAKLEFWPVAGSTFATVETNNNFSIGNAFSKETDSWLYGIESNMEIATTFHGILDSTATEGENLAWIGKTTGTWTAGSV